jgi:type VI secretion system protein ImpD
VFLSTEGQREDVIAALDRDIAALDDLIGRQLDAILHAPRFQKVESAWRGVAYLAENSGEREENVIIRLLDARWDELCRDFDRTGDFEQTQLFDKLYNQEFGMPGGRPFGLLIVDELVCHRRIEGRTTDDVGGLRLLSQVAAASFVPAIVGAHPSLLGLDEFSQLGQPIDLAAVFRTTEYQRWLSFQETEEARYIGVVLPSILLRPPYDDDGVRNDRFRYREGADGMQHGDYLWGNGAYAFASVVIRAYRNYGWFADIRGARIDEDDGGMVTGLPAPAFPADRWPAARRRPVEAELPDGQEQVLSELGFIALSPCRNSPHLLFLGNQSVHRQEAYRGPAGVNARLGTMLQYILCVCRFSHYVKVIARDRLGGFTTAEQLETYLGNWLRGYSIGNDDASAEQKARYPLRASSVQIKDVVGKPGALSCIFHLQPHFQLDQMVSGLRLQTELNAPLAGG